MSVFAPPPLNFEMLLAPLDERQPAGCFDDEDETFQGVEHEMVKLGGLHEPGMDWAYVDEASRQYLGGQCKHFRIAGHLIAARLRSRTWRGWAEAVGVLAGMVERYWETGFPKPGATGYPGKRRLVALQVERLGEALAGIGGESFAPEFHKAAQQALDRLQASAAGARLDVPMLMRLESQLSQRVEETRYPYEAEAVPITAQTGGQPISEDFFAAHAVVHDNERDRRRSLLAVAEIITQQEPYDPTGYLLRRFALWAHLNAAPPARKDQRTELMAVPADIAEGYQEALTANAINPMLLQRVEKSVTSSPYWLRGSFLAAGMAARLEMPQVAEAIRHAAERFLVRVPGLARLQFGDGRPFVDGDTLAWVSGADAGGGPAGAAREYAGLREELVVQLETQGVESLLRRLEDIQGHSADLRHRCHVMTIAADLLGARGLSWLADGLYANAHQAMRGASAPQWEPDLFNHLARHVPEPATRTPGHKD
ncbi:type VI secretion system protein TssA [Cupriavidus sp. M-11]|uniref:type VI secretion system protein TssA n=1 Tax=Cupriavidus sp. M-11 TaxID=3233038 RepID=UPI003F8E11DB